MGLNNIDLPPFLITDLYNTSLIETIDDKIGLQTEKIASDIQWKYLGNNKKNILIIVDCKNTLHLPDKQLGLLTNMLSACKLSLDDVSIVNVNNYPEMLYKEFDIFFKCNTIFLFGLDPVTFGLPVNFPYFQIQSFSGHTFLYTPSLNEIETDEILKSKLWVCLRRIFGI